MLSNVESANSNLQVEQPVKEKEMAEKLSVSRQHLASLRVKNEIPFIQAGRRYLYQPSKVFGALEVSIKKQTA